MTAARREPYTGSVRAGNLYRDRDEDRPGWERLVRVQCVYYDEWWCCYRVQARTVHHRADDGREGPVMRRVSYHADRFRQRFEPVEETPLIRRLRVVAPGVWRHRGRFWSCASLGITVAREKRHPRSDDYRWYVQGPRDEEPHVVDHGLSDFFTVDKVVQRVAYLHADLHHRCSTCGQLMPRRTTP